MERFNGPTIVQSLFSLKMFKCFYSYKHIKTHWHTLFNVCIMGMLFYLGAKLIT